METRASFGHSIAMSEKIVGIIAKARAVDELSDVEEILYANFVSEAPIYAAFREW